MKNITIIKYLLTAVDNKYIEKFTIKQLNGYDISIVIDISDKEHINTVYDMIEANIYVNKNLLGYSVDRLDGIMVVKTTNDIIYRIRVKSKRSSKINKYKRKNKED